ncbi:hypothetical protein [Brevundimonas balnearis]|uniref:MOSC domain-containing protein n=1 Tax=Brevundimonas balnearis TaxID=1572858 RepID=A0ABV6QZT5_9CAUL
MNARTVKFGIGLLAAATLGACASAVAPSSEGSAPPQLSARVQALVDANRSYPRWADFPPAPTGLPSDVEIAAAVASQRAEQAALTRDVAAIDWSLEDPEAFAAATRERVDQTRVAPITQQTRETLDAWAEALRERGRAPPPIRRRQ